HSHSSGSSPFDASPNSTSSEHPGRTVFVMERPAACALSPFADGTEPEAVRPEVASASPETEALTDSEPSAVSCGAVSSTSTACAWPAPFPEMSATAAAAPATDTPVSAVVATARRRRIPRTIDPSDPRNATDPAPTWWRTGSDGAVGAAGADQREMRG